MIQLLGILSKDHSKIVLKTFTDVDENVVPKLVAATRGISEAMGTAEIKSIEFRRDTILITESRKKYTVVALTEGAEDYIHNLLRVIAEDIDEDESVPPSGGKITDNLVKRITSILDTYITDTIWFHLPESVFQVWDPIYRNVRNRDVISSRLNQLYGELRKSSDELETTWEKFTSNITYNPEEALEYALNGDFDYACAASLESSDPLWKLFAVSMGLLSLSMTGMHAPPFQVLHETLTQIPDSMNPYKNLLQSAVAYKKHSISRSDYLHAFEKTISQFEGSQDREHLLLSFLYLRAPLAFFSTFAKKLANYFKGTSEVVRTYIRSIVERNHIIKRAYSITNSSEFIEKLTTWEGRIQEIKSELSSVLQPGILNRLLKVDLRRPEIDKKTLHGLMNVETYMTLLTALAETPILNIAERKERLQEVFNLYTIFFIPALEKGLPIPCSNIGNALQDFGVTIAELSTINPSIIENNSKKIRNTLKKAMEFLIQEAPKISPYLGYFQSMTSYLSSSLTRSNLQFEEELLLLYLILELEDLNRVEDWKQIDPHNFIARSINLFSTLASLSLKYTTGKRQKRLLQECVKRLITLQKWDLLHGSVVRYDLFNLLYYVSKILDSFSDDEAKRVTKTLLGFSRITVPDWEENDYDLALLSDPLLHILIETGHRLSRDDFIEVAKTVFQISLNAWQKYGFHEMAQDLREKYEGKIENPSAGWK